jgi:hypothetical protein
MRYAIILLLLALAVATMAQAAMLEVPLKATTNKAAAIVRGEVISQKSDWAHGYQTIYTEVVIRVDESLKGNIPVGRTVTIRVEGGEVGDTGIRVEHQPRFLEAENVLLFLREAPEDVYEIQSVEQGKYTVFGNVAYDYQGRRLALPELKQSIRYAVDQDQR